MQVTDISNDPRTFKFVFGQRRVGAFLERARTDNASSILAAQVPRFQDCEWWSYRVPVYLVIADKQTGVDIHQTQICEFSYDNESSSPRKRPRDEDLHSSVNLGSPLKRPNSQPAQFNATSTYLPTTASVVPPSYQHHSSNKTLAQQPYHSQLSGQNYGYRAMPMPIPYTAMPSLPGYSDQAEPHTSAGYARSQDPAGTRYIAEPRDHYSDQIGPAQQQQHQHHHSYNEQQPITGHRETFHVPSSGAPAFYQGSVTSSPAMWKSPLRSASSTVYQSPPPSSTLSKAEALFEVSLENDDGLQAAGSAPMLQRTSTLSSAPGSNANVTTPASTPAGWLPSNKAKLEVLGDLDDMSRNWSGDEYGLRRRLVQFWRRQEGNVIKINFRPVEPGTSRPPHAVIISCIYWEERRECFFTSVDAIYLLENLVGNKFAVEEKNRIRRNLEGFRPLTVSKGKSDSETFFKLIMGFPAPKPRNIEKDVKAFPWRILTSALRKIIGKYSASYEGLRERGTGSEYNTQQYAANQSTSTPSSAEMPPPILKRDTTSDSTSSANVAQVDGTERLAASSVPKHHPHTNSSEEDTTPAPHGHIPPITSKTIRTSSPGTSIPSLSIHVPQPSENLPVLDHSIAPSSDLERRPSFPLTGVSNVDFSEFFQSPGNLPSSGSGWPALSSLFPPPSAGLGPDNVLPRKN